MSKETPQDDPRQESDWKPSKGTDKPWKDPNQASQNPGEEPAKPDLEKWNDSKTH